MPWIEFSTLPDIFGFVQCQEGPWPEPSWAPGGQQGHTSVLKIGFLLRKKMKKSGHFFISLVLSLKWLSIIPEVTYIRFGFWKHACDCRVLWVWFVFTEKEAQDDGITWALTSSSILRIYVHVMQQPLIGLSETRSITNVCGVLCCRKIGQKMQVWSLSIKILKNREKDRVWSIRA